MLRKGIMLDTNVVLAFLHNEVKTAARLHGYEDYDFYISTLVYVEVMAGTLLHRKSDTRKYRSNFLLKSFDAAAAEVAGNLANKYLVDKSSKPYDLLIAAHALSLRLPIITSNTKDYTFGKLKVVDFSAL